MKLISIGWFSWCWLVVDEFLSKNEPANVKATIKAAPIEYTLVYEDMLIPAMLTCSTELVTFSLISLSLAIPRELSEIGLIQFRASTMHKFDT